MTIRKEMASHIFMLLKLTLETGPLLTMLNTLTMLTIMNVFYLSDLCMPLEKTSHEAILAESSCSPVNALC